jgi:hypothetical protein
VTIFDCLNDILFTKRGKLLQNVDEESSFNQYMINRWCSMYSDNMALIINNTVNWLYGAFETKQQYYKFVSVVLPRVNRKRINYIKKHKPDDEDSDDNVQLLAKRLELSQREIKSYYEFQRDCTKRAKKS